MLSTPATLQTERHTSAWVRSRAIGAQWDRHRHENEKKSFRAEIELHRLVTFHPHRDEWFSAHIRDISSSLAFFGPTWWDTVMASLTKMYALTKIFNNNRHCPDGSVVTLVDCNIVKREISSSDTLQDFSSNTLLLSTKVYPLRAFHKCSDTESHAVVVHYLNCVRLSLIPTANPMRSSVAREEQMLWEIMFARKHVYSIFDTINKYIKKQELWKFVLAKETVQ